MILYVSQDVYILHLSFYENLTFAAGDDTDPFIVEAVLNQLHMLSTLESVADDLQKAKDTRSASKEAPCKIDFKKGGYGTYSTQCYLYNSSMPYPLFV